jgi:hypothetical protein
MREKINIKVQLEEEILEIIIKVKVGFESIEKRDFTLSEFIEIIITNALIQNSTWYEVMEELLPCSQTYKSIETVEKMLAELVGRPLERKPCPLP